MQKEFSQLAFGNLIGRRLAEIGELPDSSQVTIMRPLTHACQLQVIARALIE